MINILEFTVKDLLFGLRTEYIKYIFDIEHVKPAPLMPDYVAGFTVHGKYIYPLICMEKVLELSEECSDPVGKTAIAVDIDGNIYSLIVDEILKIQEIEETSSENDVVNFYNLQGRVLEEITPQFLRKKIKFPPVKQHVETDFLGKKETQKKGEISFMIFQLGDKWLAVNTDFVRKVEDIETVNITPVKEKEWIEGVFLVKGVPVKAGNMKKLLDIGNSSGSNLIILEKERKYFGLIVDEIIDIYTTEENRINRGSDTDSIFKDFFVYSNRAIPVISESFINEVLDKYSLEIEETEDEFFTKGKSKVDILVFRIGKEKLGLKMENLDEVLELKEVHFSSYPTENEFVKGIIAKGNESYYLISYESALKEKIDTDSEDTKILVITDKGFKVAVLISDIEDIISVPEENIAELEDDSLFIKGTVIDKKGGLLNLLNPRWIISRYGSTKPVKK
ncbi:purine-binding chemotaxis protein CheW [Persephonella hydrogeniphila]|uniref:Purine-binding chemotaxis protein CheW n=1 Tax=Persephonella hydrogeniphila TaxID=198703 RepID=A0A285NKZ2_9AQUI|nr:chemotaxis protein CheW [Persephonella hydrogeniphila]SNZ10129.1 purine-binding chemotaxis protein CheW [Persephonella hydrogeniphila]